YIRKIISSLFILIKGKNYFFKNHQHIGRKEIISDRISYFIKMRYKDYIIEIIYSCNFYTRNSSQIIKSITVSMLGSISYILVDVPELENNLNLETFSFSECDLISLYDMRAPIVDVTTTISNEPSLVNENIKHTIYVTGESHMSDEQDAMSKYITKTVDHKGKKNIYFRKNILACIIIIILATLLIVLLFLI
ncbi:hypothetical protein HZS_4466, partial [Henneguya salminicola]